MLTVSRHFLINIVNVYTVHNKIDENEVYMYAAVDGELRKEPTNNFPGPKDTEA